jgi:ankyrin repeat protein
MQEMQRKQREQQLFYDLIKEGAGKTVEERVEYNKDLEYNKHANLFAVSYSTIHKAACDGSVSGIKYFMSLKSKPRIKSDDLDKFGIRPIHYAAERGFNDAVDTLLSFGCNVDARTSDEMTAMMFASKAGKLDTMRLLFEKKANLQAVNRAGMSIGHFAAQNDFVDVFGLLLEMNVAQKTAILKRIEELELEGENAPSKPVGGGADKAADAKKATAAKMAAATVAKRGDEDSDDSGKEDEDEDDGTAADEESLGTARRVEKDEDDDDIDEAERMRREFRTVLNLPDTAIIDIVSRNGTRPLHVAATFNAVRSVDFLMAHGADINATDSAGETPLHKAARRSNFDVYRAILKAGGDDSVRNLARETPKELLADITKA